MSILGASSLNSTLSLTSPPVCRKKPITAAAGSLMSFPNIRKTIFTSLPIFRCSNYITAIKKTLDPFVVVEKTTTTQPANYHGGLGGVGEGEDDVDPLVTAKLRVITEIVADRVEMHKSISEQRNNWNSLLLNSVNGIILAAGVTTAAGISSGEALLPIKVSSALLYVSATAVLAVMNKFQPSQLAEEQRKAARLFKNLLFQIEMVGRDLAEMTERVLALDRAYPLPLLGGGMLEKFPSSMGPAVWWPEQPASKQRSPIIGGPRNGWTRDLEEELTEIMRMVREKDRREYEKLGGNALKLNKLLAIAGPALTAIAAVGSSLAGSSASNWAAAAAAGALAVGVNTVQHGGQVGMVFELYRNTAGFFKLLEESVIGWNLVESDLERRENGELVEMKVALMLGRSVSELRDVAAKSRSLLHINHDDEFASKLL